MRRGSPKSVLVDCHRHAMLVIPAGGLAGRCRVSRAANALVPVSGQAPLVRPRRMLPFGLAQAPADAAVGGAGYSRRGVDDPQGDGILPGAIRVVSLDCHCRRLQASGCSPADAPIVPRYTGNHLPSPTKHPAMRRGSHMGCPCASTFCSTTPPCGYSTSSTDIRNLPDQVRVIHVSCVGSSYFNPSSMVQPRLPVLVSSSENVDSHL